MKGTKIVVTYNCNMLCSCCEYKCAPYKKSIMQVKVFKEKVRESLEMGYDDYVSIEGGEPFLNAAMLFKYLKSISSIKIKKYVKTNGYWGNTEPFMDILLDLKKHDLYGLIIEYDFYHAAYIDIDVIRNAIIMAKKCGLSVSLKAFFTTKNMSSPEDTKTYSYIKKINHEFRDLKLIFRTEAVPSKVYSENLILLQTKNYKTTPSKVE